MKIKYKPWAKGLMYLVEAVVIILSVFPILWVVMSSFKTNGEILSSPLALPAHFSLDTFIEIFQKYSFPTYFFNSLLAAGVSTLVSLLFYAMGAYVIAKFEFPGRKLLFALFTITLLVPSHSKTQPIFSLIMKLNLYDSIWGVTLVYLSAGMAMSIFVLKAGFMAIPKSLDEAATLDGASFFRTFWTINLPLAKSALATAGILMFLGNWNEYYFTLTGFPAISLPPGSSTTAMQPPFTSGRRRTLPKARLPRNRAYPIIHVRRARAYEKRD